MPSGNYSVLKISRSRSQPGLEYEIRRSARDGVLYCTCPRWTTNQGKRGCSHLALYRKQIRRVLAIGERDSYSHDAIPVGGLVEVSDHGDSVIIRVDQVTDRDVIGIELLDDPQWKINAEGRRQHRIKDVVRILG
jgi:hypothetical protein